MASQLSLPSPLQATALPTATGTAERLRVRGLIAINQRAKGDNREAATDDDIKIL
jgi:hypothetical protein